jgi:putative transposase
MHVHLVFVTKYSYRVFDKDALECLRSIFATVCDKAGAHLVEMDGEDDHVHLLAYFPGSCGGAPLDSIRQNIEQKNQINPKQMALYPRPEPRGFTAYPINSFKYGGRVVSGPDFFGREDLIAQLSGHIESTHNVVLHGDRPAPGTEACCGDLPTQTGPSLRRPCLRGIYGGETGRRGLLPFSQGPRQRFRRTWTYSYRLPC